MKLTFTTAWSGGSATYCGQLEKIPMKVANRPYRKACPAQVKTRFTVGSSCSLPSAARPAPRAPFIEHVQGHRDDEGQPAGELDGQAVVHAIGARLGVIDRAQQSDLVDDVVQ